MPRLRRAGGGSPSDGDWRIPRRGFGVLVLVYLVAGGWAYSTSLPGVFVFDDVPAIVENPHLRRLWPLSEAMRAPAGSTLSGRPVASLTFAVNHALAPPDARDVFTPAGSGPAGAGRELFLRNLRGYHVTNVALHLLAALTLFGVVRRTLLSPPLRARYGAAAGWLGGIIALLWLVHPVQTASVTYVVQRVELLMGLFYLVSLYCAIRADQTPRRRWLWIAASIAACALGMASKEVMVSAPVVVALWLALFGSARAQRDGLQGRASWVLLGGLASTWLVLLALIAASTEARAILSGLGLQTGMDATGPVWTAWSYLLTQTEVMVHYLRLGLLGGPLAIDYYGWPPARTLADAMPHVLIVAALAGGTLIAVWRRRPVGFLGAWFFLILAPSSTVVPIGTEIAAEHRMYLPLASVIAGVCTGLYSLGRMAAHRAGLNAIGRPRFVAAVALASAGLAVAHFAALTHARNRDYWGEEAVWRDAVSKRPANARARINYGIVLVGERRYAEAERQMRAALDLDADRQTMAQVHLQLGAALCAGGRCDEGLPHAERAFELDPDSPEVYAILGEAYNGQGAVARAHWFLLEAARRKPDDPRVLNRVSWFLSTVPDDTLRDGRLASELAQRSVALTGRRDPVALDSLAVSLAVLGRFDAAALVGREALVLAERLGQSELAQQLATRLAYYEERR